MGECDWRDSAANFIEPWNEASKSFANGVVRLALLGRIEHSVRLSQPREVMGDRQCRISSLSGSFGFMSVELEKITAAYGPGAGVDRVAFGGAL